MSDTEDFDIGSLTVGFAQHGHFKIIHIGAGASIVSIAMHDDMSPRDASMLSALVTNLNAVLDHVIDGAMRDEGPVLGLIDLRGGS